MQGRGRRDGSIEFYQSFLNNNSFDFSLKSVTWSPQALQEEKFLGAETRSFWLTEH